MFMDRRDIIPAILIVCMCATYCSGLCETFTYEKSGSAIEIFASGRSIFRHSNAIPAIEVGLASSSYRTHLGNFYIDENVMQRIIPGHVELVPQNESSAVTKSNAFSGKSDSIQILFFRSKGDVSPTAEVSFQCGQSQNSHMRAKVFPAEDSVVYNRLWLKMSATPEEKIYGGGEQYTHFQLRGYKFPMWAREQGVGRDYSKLVTALAEWIGNAGGDYHTTYWPQSTFLSSRLFYVHVNHSYYNVLNFANKEFHEIELWGDVGIVDIFIDVANSWPELLTKLTGFFGRQPLPPKWLYDGAVLGLQGGREKVIQKYEALKENGVKISAIWIQDWPGKFVTSLGKRVYWNWELDDDFYWPKNEAKIKMKEFKDLGVRFLSYINPHVIEGSKMYKFADERGYFIKNGTTGKTLLVDFGEFNCGNVDFTNPDAYKWYKEVLKGMLEVGFSGWMADFGGEYLPVSSDVQFYDDRETSESMHNYYSFLWAKLNREVVEETQTIGDTFIFMRSGYASSPGVTLMAWAGDQNVDYFQGDGLPSVIPAALSLGMSGMGLSHSDIGGYVSLISMVRNEELLLRWTEMSVFTQVMRTHECNRPDRNWQVYTTNATMRSFAQMSKLHTILRPYHEFVAEQNHYHGWPTQRPLFFEYPYDEPSYEIKYQYMYGPDILVAPVLDEGAKQREVYLPPDNWVYMWKDENHDLKGKNGQTIVVDAVLGKPSVFYRKDTSWKELFLKLRKENNGHREEGQGLSWALLWSDPMVFLYLLLRKLFYYVLFYF